MWTDVETPEDLIGFRVHADLIRAVVTDETLLPATIGIFGDWGGGKTSIMKMLERDLDPETTTDEAQKARYERVACLYINGWLFEGYDDAKAALLSAVLTTLGEHKRFGPKVRERAASLLKSVNWMRVARLGIQEVAIPTIAAYASGGASLVPTGLGLLGQLGGFLGGSSVAGGGDLAGGPKSGASAQEAAGTAGTDGEDTEGGDDEKDENSVDWESLIRKDKRAASPLDVRTFRERFAKLLADTKIDTLVVLIDDLDRCSPERIVDNLEAIKLFLNVPRTAFVIGADPRIVRHAIAYRYRTASVEGGAATPVAGLEGRSDEAADAEERLITDYLEKLIQIPYWLPRLSPAEIETYMALLFSRRHLDGPQWRTCLSAADTQRSVNRYGAFGYAGVKAALGGGDVAPAELATGLLFSANAAPLITEGLKGNPRQVKRFLNAFVLRQKLAAAAKLTNIREEVLVKLMILEYGRPKEFRQLFDWQATQQGTPEELRLMEAAYRPAPAAAVAPAAADASEVGPQGAPADATDVSAIGGSDLGVPADRARARAAKRVGGRAEADGETCGTTPPQPASAPTVDLPWTTPVLQRWVAMSPPLADVDLRDYFWIARDRLATTFSGLSLVPPAVRRTFEDLISGNAGRRTAAETLAVGFNEAERAALLELLSTQLSRHPDQKVGYDAFRAIVTRDVAGAAAAFAATAREVPKARVPAAVGPDLRALVASRSDLALTLGQVVEQWARAHDTRVGRALGARGGSGAGGGGAPGPARGR